MDFATFIGRQKSLQQLELYAKTRTAHMVVIKGRRRIGKSRLIEEFTKDRRAYLFSGLPPTEGITAQDQRNEFAQALHRQTGLPELEQCADWSKLFMLLYERIQSDPVVVVFDEITWMAQLDPTFLPKLKNAWDLFYKKNPNLLLILCGSISAWIEKHILGSTGYFGRISQTITLKELPLHHSNTLLENLGFKRSIQEKMMILSVTGGVPWYLELVKSSLSASDNIKALCFEPDGTLVMEHQRIFNDLFGQRSDIYMKITEFLASGAAEYQSIVDGIGYASSGALSDYLNELKQAGYVACDHAWSFKTGKLSKIMKYRLCDNYLRFYYRYIAPKLPRIQMGHFSPSHLADMPGWQGVMGLQFENLVLNSRRFIHHKLRIESTDIVMDNPYYQRATKALRGCQVDYLIHTRFNTLFVVEVKFSRQPIGCDVIEAMKDKLKRLKCPQGFACLPVLVHLNGVTEALREAEYFFEVIDFSEALHEWGEGE